MELQGPSTESPVEEDLESIARLQPHIKQVADTALPAQQVLTQQGQSRGSDDPGPVFVP